MSVPLCFHYPDTTFAKVQITKLFHKISSLLSLSIGAANILRAVKPQQMVSLLLCFITLTIVGDLYKLRISSLCNVLNCHLDARL